MACARKAGPGPSSWTGLRVLITAGPTREFLDPVRFLTNASSGFMGFALARAARDLGAEVTVVSGPVSRPGCRGVGVCPVVTALEMRRQVLSRSRSADVFIAAAAVGDWRARNVGRRKLKRGTRPLRLILEPTPDILAEVSRRRGPRMKAVVGFALETHRLLGRAREKLERKGLDVIVANRPSALGARSARLTILDREGRRSALPEMGKRAAAREILRRVEAFLT